MKTAEEFAEQYLSAIGADTDEAPALADAIRARDNATRLALLDELQQMVEDSTREGWSLLMALTEAADVLRAKYTQPAQPSGEKP